MTAAPEATADFLEHFGVQGMKWGVRRADKKWKKSIGSVHSSLEIRNASVKMMNKELPALNNNPKYKGKKIDWGMYADDPRIDKTSKDYIRDYLKLHEKSLTAAVKEVYGTSPSGKFQAEYQNSEFGKSIVVKKVEIEHAVTALSDMVFKFSVDDAGKVVLVQEAEEIMEQSADSASDFLEHYGIKGMRWGVRNRRDAVKISNDAKRADYALKKVNPKVQTQYKPLSNNALKDLKTRLQLEADIKKLMPTPEAKVKKTIDIGAKQIAWALGIGLTMNKAIEFYKSPAGKLMIEKFLPRPDGKHYGS